MQRFLLRVLPSAWLSSAVILYLALVAPFSRWDRALTFLVLAVAYTAALVVLRAVILGTRAVWLQVRGSRVPTVAPLDPWELYAAPCLLASNLVLVLCGYKDVVFRQPTSLGQLDWPLQFALVLGMCVVFFLVFRRLSFSRWFRESASTRAQLAFCLLPLVLVLFPPDRAPSRLDKPLVPLASPPAIQRGPLVVLAIDGVDWRILKAAIGTGRLPHLEQLVSQGVTSSLDNDDYGFSPPVWTTLITGQSRHVHGIYDFVTRRSPVFARPLDAWWEKIPAGFGVKSIFGVLSRAGIVEERLSDGQDRYGPSIFQILSRFGRRSLVVNYMISGPAEDIDGVFLPAGIVEAAGEGTEPRTVPLLHVRGVSRRNVVEFALVAGEFDRLAEVTIGLMKTESFDLVTFYTPWTDWFNHFMSIPEYESVLAGRFDAGLPTAMLQAYERVDGFVAQLRAVRPEANILIVSDHGVGTGYRFRHRVLQHSRGCPGIFAAQGPDVSHPGMASAVSMFDFAPTVLAYFGAPLARDFRGRARSDVLTLAPSEQMVDSYQEAVANQRRPTSVTDTEAMTERLKALGYIE